MLFCQKLEVVGWCRFFHSDPSIQWQIYQKHILSVLNSLEACRCWWKLGIFSCKMQSMDQGKQQHTKLPAVFCMACGAASLILQIEQIKSVPVFIISCLLCLCHRNFGFLNRELTILYQWKASFQLSWGSVHAWQVHNHVNLTRELMDLFKHCLFVCVFKKA